MLLLLLSKSVSGVQILSKSKLEKCEKKVSDSNNDNNLNCTTKIVINMAVPSESVCLSFSLYFLSLNLLEIDANFECVVQSGREASLVAELVEVEENSTNNMRTLRIPPVITVNKSAAYALYELTYIRVGLILNCPLKFIISTFLCMHVCMCILPPPKIKSPLYTNSKRVLFLITTCVEISVFRKKCPY